MKTYLKTKLNNVYLVVGECSCGYICKFFEDSAKHDDPFFIHYEHTAIVDTNLSIVSSFKVKQNEQ